ncbi:MAG: ACP S-malonyltransferase, partial [Actinomycetota bacterium]|nr:ACP S-malonyltransferase [Actinomycetota bacterium]
MGRPWVDHRSWAVVDEASELLHLDLASLLLDADADELALTTNAQLATFVTSLMVLDALRRSGVTPAA